MTSQYDRMVRIKPIIAADSALMARFKACFLHQYEKSALPNEIQVVHGRSRGVYICLGKVTDPFDGLECHLELKLGANDVLHYGTKIFSAPPLLAGELGALETYSPPDGPEVLGVVRCNQFRAAGLLMEDFSKAGTLNVITLDSCECEGDYLKIGDRIVRSDAKRQGDGYIEQGNKYFSLEACLEV